MSAAQHTPGPWKFVTDFRCSNGDLSSGVKSESTGSAVAWIHGRDAAEEIANGQLIAAAPLMKEVCDFMLSNAFRHKWDGDEWAYTKLCAIAKATRSAA